MNEVVSRMINTQALLFLYMLAGIAVSKMRIITNENRKVLVRLLMDVCVPMMVLDAFNRTYTAEEIRSSMVIMALSAVFCVLTGALGLLLWRGQDKARKPVLQFATMFSNAGIAGLPVISLVYGEMGLFYASMYLIPPRILQWTYGVSMFTTGKEGGERGSFVKNVLLNPVVIIVYIGFIMLVTGTSIPGVPGAAIAGIGDMTAPMSMMLLGATLANMNLRMLFDRSVLAITGLRLLALPALSVLMLSVTGIDPLIISVSTTLLAMPIATNSATIAERYGGDYVFASACVSVSTLLSVVTVPVVTWFVQQMIV